MKPMWTQIPLPKVADKQVAEYYVARGWAKTLDDIYIELSPKQKEYRKSLSTRRVSIKSAGEKPHWTTLPVSYRVMSARKNYLQTM